MQPSREDPYADLSALGAEGQARSAALQAIRETEYRPAPLVTYASSGRVMIIGSEARALEVARRLPPQLSCLVVAAQTQTAEPGTPETRSKDSPELTVVHAPLLELKGYLGRFTALVGVGHESVDPLTLIADRQGQVDLVMDLTTPPWFSSEIPPLGYFAPGDDPAALDAAVSELPELVGHFEKPAFFEYDPDICAHSRSGLKACTRCIDACPTDAITSAGDRGIEIDIHLCQGAGVCASACPTGAVRYTYPHPADNLQRLRQTLRAYREAGGEHPLLLFHDAEEGRRRIAQIGGRLPENVIPIEVEEIGCVGMDLGLAALAYGAHRVLLLGTPTTAAGVVREIDAQLVWAQALLEGMGYPPEALFFDKTSTDAGLLEELRSESTRMVLEKPAGFAALDEKRTVIRLALEHLYGQAPASRPLVSLSAGAPFGDVWLVEDRCTLCMACVSQCPGKALMAGDDSPQLKFVEDNCVQCGICARACPEDAIAPSPRYLFDSQARRSIRLLKEEEPFLCIRCGTAFATHSVIQQITARLKGNPNLGPAEFKRLKMCEDCRGEDLLETEQRRAMAGARETPL